jgi:hypothetical protein
VSPAESQNDLLELPRRFRRAYLNHWVARIPSDRDRARFPERLADLSFVALSDKKFDRDAQWEAMGVLYPPMRDPSFPSRAGSCVRPTTR